MSKKMMSMLLALLFIFHSENCCFVSVKTLNPDLVTSDNPRKEGSIVGGDIMKLLADTDADSSHQLSESWEQVWMPNSAVRIRWRVP
jgi:hypothetical protein